MDRRSLTAFVTFALVLWSVPLGANPAAAASPNLVISQVYGGGGNVGPPAAPYLNDYIEIFNRGTSTVSLIGLSLQYASATGTGNFGANSGQLTEFLGGTLAPGQYLLVQEASGGTTGVPLPAADIVDGTPINMSATGGKVALVSGTASLGCNGGSIPCSAEALARIIDLTGYGSANFFEGAGAAPTLSNTTAALRGHEGCDDTDNNSADFAAGTPLPRNTVSPLHVCGVDQPPAVASTTPASGANGVALNANVSITFSEPVTTSGVWFTMICATSGAHTAATTGGPTTFTLDPAVNFAAGESCTVTVVGANVTDQDTSDPPDNMTGNYVFTFQTAEASSCGDPATRIHDVQGSGLSSPIIGASVVIEGVVVGDYQQPGGFGGFYVQEEAADADADPLTSEGIFVFNASFAVNAGDIVRLRGTATEFFDLTEITSVNALSVCSSGTPVPATAVSLPVANVGDLERYEGMLVRLDQTLTATEVFNLGRFGEVSLSGVGRLYTPTAITTPGAAAIAQLAQNNRSRIILDDGNSLSNIDPTLYPQGGLSASNTLRVGDTLGGLTGVMDYRFNNYRVQPVGPLSFVHANARTAAPAPVGGNLKIASFNVLNFFNGDGLGGGFPTPRGANTLFEFQRQLAKEVSALTAINADIVGLMELENDAPPHSAIEDLVAALNAVMGAGTYSFIDTGVIGTDAIKVALIYKPAAVTPANAYQIITSGTDPRFIDTLNRPSLAQTFTQNASGQKLTVVVNHLKSKGSACAGDPDTGDGQGNCNLTRTAAAAALVDWLAGDPTGSGDPDFLLIGDMNSYTFEDPITTFTSGGFTNLVRAFGGLGAYSYVFNGESGYLDHGLATGSLAAQVTGATDWHINPDEPVVLDYNTEFKTANQITTFYDPGPYRSSDHDPVIIGLSLDDTPPTITPPPDVTRGTGAGATTCGVFISDANLGTATATDNGGVVTITRSGVPTGNLFPVGATTITYVATDSAGNTASATQTVTVFDNTLPTLTAPPAITRGTGPGATSASRLITDAELGSASASDNCGATTITRSGVPSGNLFPVGTTTITYTATDGSGNTTSATQSVTVVDDTPPAITPPPAVTRGTGAGATECAVFISDADLGTATATDNAGVVTITRSALPSGNLFPVGSTTITYIATDGAGNTASATQTVTVSDTTPPTIAVPPAITRGTGPAATTATRFIADADLGSASASDNCGPTTVTRSGVPSGNLFPVGTTTITYTATDASGNTTSATQSVTVVDDTLPVISGAPTTAANANGWYNAAVTIHFTCADNVAIASCEPDRVLSGDGAAQMVTGTATDTAGNTATTTVGPISIDTHAPTITFAGSLIYDVDETVAISCTIVETLSGLDPAVTQTCPSANGPAFSFGLGSHTLTASATDRAGNHATATVTFTVGIDETSLCTLTQALVTIDGVAGSLCAKLDAAAASTLRGNTTAHANQLEAYRKEIEAQTGKAITEANAAILITLSRAL